MCTMNWLVAEFEIVSCLACIVGYVTMIWLGVYEGHVYVYMFTIFSWVFIICAIG